MYVNHEENSKNMHKIERLRGKRIHLICIDTKPDKILYAVERRDSGIG